jgi:NADH:ubiquinone oxidoreductase subunit 4 (subunit M)
MPALSILIWLPAACGLLGAAVSALARRTGLAAPSDTTSEGERRPAMWAASVSGLIALAGALGALGLAVAYIVDYRPGSGLTDVTDTVWISELGIHYKLGISGLNVFLVGLTTLLFAAAVIAANLRLWDRPRLFYFQFMLAESAVLGAFLAQDLALFVAFFDLMLIPFYFLIGGWGREPGRPLHGWMPDGYRAMPIEVLMVFSGVLAKVGAYGFLAIVLPLFPHAAVHFQTLMLLIALVSIIYGSMLAAVQNDARLIVGYSSVAQLGFITLGIFALNSQGAQGALLQMVNHGLVVAPLLFIVALLARRAGGSEDIRDMGGIAFRAPVFAALFLIVSLATLAMPGSSNFVGEFLILLGVFKAKLVISILGFSGVVMASVYALRLFIRSMHNRLGRRDRSYDIAIRDGAVLVPLIAVIVFLALYPQLVLHRTEGSAKASVAAVQPRTRPSLTAVGPRAVQLLSAGGGEARTAP